MKPRRKKKKLFTGFRIIIPFVFVLAVMWVWKSIEVDNLSRKLTELERTKKNLSEQGKMLRIELERYRSIAWIDRCVRQNYGMTYNVKKRLVLFDKPVENPGSDLSLLASIGGIIKKAYNLLARD